MKTFLMAFAAAIVIAVVGSLVLNGMQETASDAFSVPSSVRLGA